MYDSSFSYDVRSKSATVEGQSQKKTYSDRDGDFYSDGHLYRDCHARCPRRAVPVGTGMLRPFLLLYGIDVLRLLVIHNEITQDRLPQGARGTVASVKHRLVGRWNEREAIAGTWVECSRFVFRWIDVPQHRPRW